MPLDPDQRKRLIDDIAAALDDQATLKNFVRSIDRTAWRDIVTLPATHLAIVEEIVAAATDERWLSGLLDALHKRFPSVATFGDLRTHVPNDLAKGRSKPEARLRRRLLRDYAGVWGAKVFWLATLTLLPLVVRFKSDLLGLLIGPATVVYVIYHALGIYVWMQVRQLIALPNAYDSAETRAHIRVTSRQATVAHVFSLLVVSLLATTVLAKVELVVGDSGHYRARFWPWVYPALGVPTPIQQVIVAPGFESLAMFSKKAVRDAVSGDGKCEVEQCLHVSSRGRRVSMPLPRNGVLLSGGRNVDATLLRAFREVVKSADSAPAALSPSLDLRKGDRVTVETCCREICAAHEWEVGASMENLWVITVDCP